MQVLKDTELNRVLGGGIVAGSLILFGGEPGIGKSTLSLQMALELTGKKVLYVTGEESEQQVKMRAERMGEKNETCYILSETNTQNIFAQIQAIDPQILIIDSIQTLHTAYIESSPGSISQIKECAAEFLKYAKTTGVPVFLIGHITKEGSIAGPKVLEHMIDCSIMLEGGNDSRFRTLRGIKNRFGAINELGVFAMLDSGLKEVKNPSSIFLSRGEDPAPGSVVMVVWEGTRPLLVEIQALVDESHVNNPRRVAVGLEQNRLAMLLAVLNRHGGLMTGDQDVFVNVVGGVKVLETGADLALLLAVVSSFRDRSLPQDLMAFGEVGLSGEIRPVPNGQERIREAAKHGFRRAIVPKANVPKDRLNGMEVVGVTCLSEALDAI